MNPTAFAGTGRLAQKKVPRTKLPKNVIVLQSVVQDRVELGVAAIFNREFDYLPEWIDWMVGQGVRRFFLFQHDPAELDKSRISEKHQDLITLVDWRRVTKDKIQRKANTYAARHFGKLCDYLFIADIDEFPMAAFPERDGTFLTALKRAYPLSKLAGKTHTIRVRRYDFGHTPFERAPTTPKHIWDAFRFTSKENEKVGVRDFGDEKRQGKSIIVGATAAGLDFAVEGGSAHFGVPDATLADHHVILDLGKHLRLNHYYTKSEEEATSRKKGWQDSQQKTPEFNGPVRARVGNIAHLLKRYTARRDDTALAAARAAPADALSDQTYPLRSAVEKLNQARRRMATPQALVSSKKAPDRRTPQPESDSEEERKQAQ